MISVEKPGTPKELVHFGTKGMKWGVRNQRTSSPELKRQAKISLAKKASPVAEARIGQMLDLSPLSVNDYKNMSTRSAAIPSEKTLYRMTQNPKDVSLSGFSYVTTNKRDAEIYRGLLPAQRLFDPLRKSDYKQYYEVTSKTTKPLRGPSEKQRVDILAQLMSDKTAVNGKMSLREYYKKSNVISRKDAKHATDLELALKVHRRVHQNLFNRKDKVSQAYINAVAKKGYDILADDNDSGIVSKNPLIILNSRQSTHTENTKRLSNDDILKAQINLKFPKRR